MFLIGHDVLTLTQLDADIDGISLPPGTLCVIHQLPEDNGGFYCIRVGCNLFDCYLTEIGPVTDSAISSSDGPAPVSKRVAAANARKANAARVAATVLAAAKAWDIAAADRTRRGDELLEMDVYAPEEAGGARVMER